MRAAPLLLALLASACGGDENPLAPGPVQQQPYTQTLGGTVSIFGTTRHSLNIPRSGNMRISLSWSGGPDLDLYLTTSGCQELYPLAACGVVLASDSTVGTQETITQSVTSGQAFALFIDNLSTARATSYTLDIRID